MDYRSFIPIVNSLDSVKELYIQFRTEFEQAEDILSLNKVLDEIQ